MENNTFSYNYSAARNKDVERIRRKYMPQEESKLERLKKLDLRVQMAGTIESLCFGIVGVLVFGIGMCFFLDVFAGEVWFTALLMVLGATGGVISVLIVATAIYMIVVGTKKLNELKTEVENG